MRPQKTILVPPPAAPPSSGELFPNAKKPRCEMVHDEGSSSQFTLEIERLLRRRLLLACLIGLGGFGFFLVRNALDIEDDLSAHAFMLGFHGVVCLVLAAGAGLLWSRCPLRLSQLRAMEMIIFAVMAAFFAWGHFEWFETGKVLQSAVLDNQHTVVRLAGNAVTLRWFGLLVIYGTFIPNTWRRCALMVAAMASIPLTLTLLFGLMDSTRAYLTWLLPDLLILLLMASSIAIFGSYKISELHVEAFEARKLGQYQLKKRLGAGGMGEVYLAEHVLLRRPCAVKLIRPEQAGDPKNLLRFEREVQATATLTHWNTIEIFDYGHTEDGTFYYVMEYLPGLSLEELVERYGPLEPARAVHLLRQVCHALREAHGIGLLHRDIKPSNIIACERGQVPDVAKLLDFGLVKGYRQATSEVKLTRDDALAGSPAYMSPEQAVGKVELDSRSDIYSLGAVAYYLLTGQLVFERDTPMETLVAHIHDLVLPLRQLQPGIPADLEAVVLSCLEKDPAKRFPDAASLETALAQCGCADQWTRELAAAWWQEVAPGHSPAGVEPDSQTATILAAR
jgi:serine/threonine-protein kinase